MRSASDRPAAYRIIDGCRPAGKEPVAPGLPTQRLSADPELAPELTACMELRKTNSRSRREVKSALTVRRSRRPRGTRLPARGRARAFRCRRDRRRSSPAAGTGPHRPATWEYRSNGSPSQSDEPTHTAPLAAALHRGLIESGKVAAFCSLPPAQESPPVPLYREHGDSGP